MLLTELIDHLRTGELSQLYMGVDGGEVEFTDEHLTRLIGQINLALTALHSRFLLREGKLKLERVPGLSTYVLNSRYAQANNRSRESVRYIMDTANPFLDDILKIERVYDQDGREVGLNDDGDPDGVSTPTHTSLYVPMHLETETLTVVYRANHPTIVKNAGFFRPEAVEVDLPMSHVEPLLLYIASRMLNPLSTQNEFHEGNNYAAKYEAACQRIENLNYRIDKVSTVDRITRNGWV